MGFESNKDDVSLLYFVMKRNPGIEKSEILQRMATYSNKRENVKMHYEAYPVINPVFKKRQLMNVFGDV